MRLGYIVLAGLLVGCGSAASSANGFTGLSLDGGSETGSLGNPGSGKDSGGTGRLGGGGGDGGQSCGHVVTCASAGAQCGTVNDGCGGVIHCGSCGTGQTCGGGGTANQCGSACVPTTCQALGINCGPAGDGCGGMLDCGTCDADAGQTCGGGGTASVCGSGSTSCTPTTCGALGFNCGPAGDGCGGTLQCGTCADAGAGETCGGGGKPSVCGGATCTPKTCADIGPATCGAQADGCGGLLQCPACDEPKTCGGQTPGQCGIPSTCTNLCLQQQTCSNPAVTTQITGTVYAPNGTDPLPNVLVYIPNGTVDAFTQGVTCGNCSTGVSGDPLVTAVTDTHGNFTLANAPVGSNIPLVIQTGKWRRQTKIPNVASCVTTALPACTAATAANGTCLTSLPQTKAQGDIPHMAFATGSIDSLECVMRKIGVADSEFTDPSGTGRVNFYVGFLGAYEYQNEYYENGTLGGAKIDSATPTEDQLVGSLTTLEEYDMVLFPCEEAPMDDTVTLTLEKNGSPVTCANPNQCGGGAVCTNGVCTVSANEYVFNQQSTTLVGEWSTLGPQYQSNVIDYANMGGRIFATHYSYIWLYNDNPFNTTAQWNVNQCDSYNTQGDGNCSTGPTTTPAPAEWGFPPDQTGYIQTNFPKGLELAEWLQNIGASTTQGQIGINTLRWDIDANGVNDPPSQLWMQIEDTHIGDVPMHMTFNTPIGTAAANQCGEVLFDDFHVENPTVTDSNGNVGLDDGFKFPNECTTTTMTAQEKLLEFMIFDLGSCVGPSQPTCAPTTCFALGYNCGPAGDGCGNELMCGTCPSGQTCGGGGTPSVCGAPTCTATTCAAQGIQCGPAGDGCGNELMCGTCPAGQTCGGGGKPGVCGAGACTPTTCSAQGIQCGPAGNGCGDELMCGTCPAGETCGGGGKAGQCGDTCTPTTCQALGYDCGAAADGCGGELMCGTCSAPNTCGGGGQANVCGGSVPKIVKKGSK